MEFSSSRPKALQVWPCRSRHGSSQVKNFGFPWIFDTDPFPPISAPNPRDPRAKSEKSYKSYDAEARRPRTSFREFRIVKLFDCRELLSFFDLGELVLFSQCLKDRFLNFGPAV